MKNTFILSLLLLTLVHTTQAQEEDIKNFSRLNSVGGFFLGKLGLVMGEIRLDDGNEYENADCYTPYQEFDLDNWHIEFGTACASSATIENFLSDNNHEYFNNYQQVIQQIKDFTEYLYGESINIDLTLVFLDGKVMFKKKYRQLVYDKISMHISQLTFTQDVKPEDNIIYYSYLINIFNHELFHAYNRKVLRKKNKSHKKMLKNPVNDEMLASIIGKCSELVFRPDALSYTTLGDLYKFYQKGEPVESAYPQSTFVQTAKKVRQGKVYLLSFGYAHAEYAMWNQFGIGYKVRSAEEIRDILKYCRYVVQTIPDVEQIKTITPDDYASMPEPDFLATYE